MVTVRRLHKWIGIGIGLILLMWIGTGVMMVLPQQEPLRVPLDQAAWVGAAVTPAAAVEAASPGTRGRVVAMNLHTIEGQPVYRIYFADGSVRLVDARSGELFALTDSVAKSVARRALDRPDARVRSVERLESHQLRYLSGPLPVFRVVFDDGHNTVIYVNARDGSVQGGGTARRIRVILGGLHTFYPLRVVVRSARAEVGLLLLACGVAIVGVFTGYWLALPGGWRRRWSARRSVGADAQ